MRYLPWIPAFLLCIVVPVTSAQQPSGVSDRLARRWPAIVRAHADLVTRAGIVGSSLAVVHDGALLAAHHHGMRDLESKAPVDEDTIYHWASITKTFTGIAIMQLRDRGMLSLDDPVVKYVPELRDVHAGAHDIAAVRVRHLMSHSAGFRSSTWPWGGDKPWHPFEPPGWAQLAAMLPYTELLFAPGSRYQYSNPGVIFLGRIIERLSGDDYEVYVTKNILMPLGMHQTFFDRAPLHLVARRSHSYVRGATGLREQRFDFDTGITVSNGGLNAPFTDMARYLGFLTGQGRPPASAVLARSSLEEMFTPQIRARDGEGGSGDDVQAALSFFVERYDGVELVGHSGDQNGFRSHLYLHRPSRTGYLVAYNTDASAVAGDPRSIDTSGVDAAIRTVVIRDLLQAR